MDLRLDDDGLMGRGTFTVIGGLGPEDAGSRHPVYIELQFRMATNGVIVNTLVNTTPVSTTSAGLFNR